MRGDSLDQEPARKPTPSSIAASARRGGHESKGQRHSDRALAGAPAAPSNLPKSRGRHRARGRAYRSLMGEWVDAGWAGEPLLPESRQFQRWILQCQIIMFQQHIEDEQTESSTTNWNYCLHNLSTKRACGHCRGADKKINPPSTINIEHILRLSPEKTGTAAAFEDGGRDIQQGLID